MELLLDKKFKDYEVAVLMAFDRALNSQQQEIFRQQMTTVNSLGREYKNTSVNMYSRKFLKVHRVGGDAFPDMPEEYLAAKFSAFDDKDTKAEFWFINGRPFSIEFSGSMNFPKTLKWKANLSEYFIK